MAHKADLQPALRYEPRGAARKLLISHDREVLLSGPAGTGKTLAGLWKLHYCCSRVPGVRAMIIRKTRASLTQSVLVTFERDVLPAAHPARQGPARNHRESYRYPNGSEIALGGMDLPSRIMSSDYDFVYIPEATEVSEDGWESLVTRLRNGRMPYQQLLADCNPDRPTHWLKVRCDLGRTRLIESRHEDNPLLYANGEWTPFGRDYLATLDNLTGPRKARLRYGRWVRAEGVVYEGWDALAHLIDQRPIPDDWPRIWVVDFGFRNPFVWQNWALDGDGRLYLTRQIYHTGRLVSDHAARIKELTAGEPPPVAVLCDHDAEDRATLEACLGLPTMPAPKKVKPGIECVQNRLRVQGDGKPRLFILRDSLDEVDPELQEAKRPWTTEQEFDGYIWSDGIRKEEPVKQDDHGMDCVRYLAMALDGPGIADSGREKVYRA